MRKDDSEFAVEIGLNPIHTQHGDGVLMSIVDITERKRVEAELRRTAFHDSLTGLPNRTLFLDNLLRLNAAAKRYGHRPFALLFLDLDRFKVINDSLGHSVGDKLLIEVAQRLVECTREEDTVARLSGDEFAILLEQVRGPEDAVRVATQRRGDGAKRHGRWLNDSVLGRRARRWTGQPRPGVSARPESLMPIPRRAAGPLNWQTAPGLEGKARTNAPV